MHGPAHGARGHCPVRWLNRHALVTLPERVEESSARLLGEQLLSIVDSDALVLILDMTATAACDHAGRLPGSLTVEVPCHSPRTERWFDMLISARRNTDGQCTGATVTLSLTRSQTQVLLPAGAPGGSGQAAGPGTGPDASLVGELTGRLAGVARILEESTGEACPDLAGQLRQALGELDAVIRDAHASVAPRDSGPPG